MTTTAESVFSGVEEEIQEITHQMHGELGIAVRALDSEASFFHNEHMLCPSASTIKIHVLLELFNQVQAGKLKLGDTVEIPRKEGRGPEWGPTSSGVMKALESIPRISLKDAATLMIIVSDNVTTNLLIDLLGVGNIQRTIQNLGLKSTKLTRKMMDLQSAARGLENLSSPYEMMVTLEKIARTEVLDANSCKTMLDILSKTQDVLGLRRLLPETTRIEHKTGELLDVCHDVGIIRVRSNPFIISVMTKNVNLVEGWDAIAQVGKTFYDRLRPGG